ncbi:hypothetical protein D3C80_866680 [compost metagenome]
MAVDEEKFGAQQADAVGAQGQGLGGLDSRGDIGGDFDQASVTGLGAALGGGLLLIAALLLLLAKLRDLGQAFGVWRGFQSGLFAIHDQYLACLQVHQLRAQGNQAWQPTGAGEDGDMRGRATGDHAQPGYRVLVEQQQVRGRQFMGGDNCRRRQVQLSGFAEQVAQYPLLQILQVVGALGQQRLVECLEDRALGVDGLAPGVAGGGALVDALARGVDQGRIVEQCQVRFEDGCGVALLQVLQVSFNGGLDAG